MPFEHHFDIHQQFRPKFFQVFDGEQLRRGRFLVIVRVSGCSKLDAVFKTSAIDDKTEVKMEAICFEA
jgi:hypothetical protein